MRLGITTAAVAALLLLPCQASAVVGGQDASKPYPHMVAMTANDGEWAGCGGSLVRQDWVLTAAHCVEGAEAKDVGWLVGTQVLSEPERGEEIAAAEILVHPEWGEDDDAMNSHDVALVRLQRPATKGSPIRVPSPAEKALWKPATKAWGIGWGTQVHGDPGVTTADQLQEVDVPIVTDPECSRFYVFDEPSGFTFGHFESQTMVCAGYTTGNKDTCYGDSGGPLMVPDATGALVQVGVVSWGFGCAYPSMYGVYARVADTTLYSWIDSKLAAAASTTQSADAPSGTSAPGTAQNAPAQQQPAPRAAASSQAAKGSAKAKKRLSCQSKARKIRSKAKRKRALRACAKAAAKKRRAAKSRR